MKSLKFFILSVVIAGIFALLGSALGAVFGRRSLFVGGFIGGLVGSSVAAWFGSRFHWIPPSSTKAAAVGASVGFLVAATIAVNSLRTPIGPALSTLLVGVGGLIGVRLVRGRNDSADEE